MEAELIFTIDGLTIRMPVKVPIVGESIHEERINYDELPANGMMMTISSIDKKVDEAGKLNALVFKVSSFQLLGNTIQADTRPSRIEVTLTPSSLRYNLIPVHRNNRKYFPSYKEDFDLETNIGNLRCHVTGRVGNIQPGDQEGGQYIVGGLKSWFEKNKPKPGEKVFIEIIEPRRKYRLIKPDEI
jgi:hypothetical protein